MAKSTLVDSLRAALRPLSLVGRASGGSDLWSEIASRLSIRRGSTNTGFAPYRFDWCPYCDGVMLLHGPGRLRASAEQMRDDLLVAVAGSSSGNALVDLTQTHRRPGACAAFVFEHSMPEGLRGLSRVALVVRRRHVHNAHIDRANACRHGAQAEVFTDRRSAENWLREFMPEPIPADAQVARSVANGGVGPMNCQIDRDPGGSGKRSSAELL